MANVLFLLGLVALLVPVESAWAYLDPGGGSVLLQVILGGLAGLAVGAKLFWHRLVAFLTFSRRDKGGDE